MNELQATNIPEPIKWELTEYERGTVGFVDGLAEGKAKGKAEGHRESLLIAIEARGFALTEAQRAAIDACHEVSQLDHWLRRLFHVDSAEALFAPG